MASTGFSLDAEKAGIKPDIKPIINETPNPKKILLKVKVNSKSKP